MNQFVDRVSKGALLSGLALLPWMLVGCGSSPSGTAGGGGTTPPVTDMLAPGGASTVYTVQQVYQGSSPSLVLGFTSGSNGSVSPATTLTMPDGFEVLSMTANSAGQIYVGGSFLPGQNEMLEYAAGATGQATPVRTILYPYTIFNSMAVDATGTLYVGFEAPEIGSISIFPPAASGTVPPPVQEITGPLTQIYSLVGLAVDSAGYIYAANYNLNFTGSILVFAPGATGNVAPVRVITLSDYAVGIALDASGNLFVAATEYPSGPGKILEFAPGATGAATPIRTISGSATGMLVNGGLQVDSVGNLYVATETAPPAGSSSEPALSLLAFGPTAKGDIAPAANLSSSSWSVDDNNLMAIAVH